MNTYKQQNSFVNRKQLDQPPGMNLNVSRGISAHSLFSGRNLAQNAGFIHPSLDRNDTNMS